MQFPVYKESEGKDSDIDSILEVDRTLTQKFASAGVALKASKPNSPRTQGRRFLIYDE